MKNHLLVTMIAATDGGVKVDRQSWCGACLELTLSYEPLTEAETLQRNATDEPCTVCSYELPKEALS